MATLQELRPMIDEGKSAVLFLAHDHPLNEERKDLRIFISRTSNGAYHRKLAYVNTDPWSSPPSRDLTWQQLLDKESALVEATSDQWTIQS